MSSIAGRTSSGSTVRAHTPSPVSADSVRISLWLSNAIDSASVPRLTALPTMLILFSLLSRVTPQISGLSSRCVMSVPGDLT